MQGMAGPFRSRTTEGIAYEVAGHLMLYTLVRLLMAAVAAQSGTSPLRLSYKGAVDEVRDMGESLLKASQRHAQRFLQPRLLELIGSHRVAYRPNRHFPRPNDSTTPPDRGVARNNGCGPALPYPPPMHHNCMPKSRFWANSGRNHNWVADAPVWSHDIQSRSQNAIGNPCRILTVNHPRL